MDALYTRDESDIGRRIEDGTFDRLIVGIVQKEDEDALSDALNARGIPHTRIDTKGGFLRTANTAFVCLCHQSRRGEVLDILRRTCRARTERVPSIAYAGPPGAYLMGDWNDYLEEVPVGGATVFELQIEDCQRI